jgi:hypothetical protein
MPTQQKKCPWQGCTAQTPAAQPDAIGMYTKMWPLIACKANLLLQLLRTHVMRFGAQQ